MPIYAYRCSACGHAKDVLQKLSDPVLSTCPACGADTFTKQVTAAGFQLKGSGWYATDFKGGSGGTKAPAAAPAAEGSSPSSSSSPSPSTGGDSGGGKSEASASSGSGGGTACGGSCACH